MSEVLVETGNYAPFVLHAGHLRRQRAGVLDLIGKNSYRLFGVVDGTLTLRDGDEVAERFRPGEVLLLPPAGEWTLHLSQDYYLIHAVFDLVSVPREKQDGRWIHRQPVRPQPAPTAVWGVELPLRLPEHLAGLALKALRMINLDYWRHACGYARALGRLVDLLGQIAVWAYDRDHETVDPTRVEDDLVREAIALLVAPSGRRLHVHEVADILGVSREHLARRARPCGIDSLARHQRDSRLAFAAQLLQESDQSIAAIARCLGYGQETSFTRAFRKRYGVAPSHFRSARRW